MKLKEAYDLRQVIPATPFRKRYANYDVDRCPFHDDRRPSLLIKHNYWECKAGCGSGDVVEWTSRSSGISKEEAIRQLRAGISTEPVVVRKQERKQEVEEMPQSLGLKHHLEMKEREREWYRSRGLSDNTIDEFQLGYAVPYGHGRFSIPVYEDGRLVNIRYRKDDRCPECFSPYTEGADEWTCLECGNIWTPRDKLGKYLGVKDHNEPRLFNRAKHPAKRVFIAEGEFDVMVLHQQGYQAVCSTSGAATFLSEWGKHFLPYKQVYVVYDCDKAGVEGAKLVVQVVPKARIVTLPLGEKGDVTDFFQIYGRGDFEDLLKIADRDPVNNLELRLARTNGSIHVK
jgi:DNA primase